MELDKRIEKLSDILACVNVEEAKQFIGQKGYFADSIFLFDKLEERKYDVLANTEEMDMPFLAQNTNGYWRYFIPECRLKPKEKKYRPYTLEEFLKVFIVGLPIKFRCKETKLDKLLIFNGYKKLSDVKDIVHISGYDFTLKDLFDGYEWQEHDGKEWKWKPFGVEKTE